MITANTWFKMSFALFEVKHIQRLQERFKIKPAGIDTEAPPVTAFVNHGAWLIKCPNPDCKGAEYAWEEGFFYCFSCHNGYMGHKIRRSVFPPERRAIEKALERRPLLNRNWLQGETVGDLQAENKKHSGELLPAGKEA